MVKIEFGEVNFSVPKEVKGDEIAEEAFIYADIATFLMAIPEVLEEHPRLKKSIKQDLELLKILANIGHIVAG